PAIVAETLLAVLCTPPIMAAFVGGPAGHANPPFLATRPLATAGLIAAKLEAAMWTALAPWLPVAGAVPIAVQLSGSAPLVLGWARGCAGALGTPRAAALALLVLAALVAATWKQLVQRLFIGLSGRPWLVKGSVFATLAIVAFLLPVAD